MSFLYNVSITKNSTLQLKGEQLFIQKDMESSRMEKHVQMTAA